MSRRALALALSLSLTSVALARNLCIQFDNGSLAGSQLVLKKVKLGRLNVGPVQGHLAIFSQILTAFGTFEPIYGPSVVNANGDVAMGITVPAAGVLPGGGLTSGTGATPLNVTCSTTGDGSLDVVDPCGAQCGSATWSSTIGRTGLLSVRA
jgi:hypothetical protein